MCPNQRSNQTITRKPILAKNDSGVEEGAPRCTTTLTIYILASRVWIGKAAA